MVNYDPFDRPCYYHYCTNQTFLTILERKTILCADLTLSNDKMESSWILKFFKELIVADEILRPFSDDILCHVKHLASYRGALGFCMSRDGDMLSQWRGYADDGRGFSIGFFRPYCEEPKNFISDDCSPAAFIEVEYDRNKQNSLLKPYCDSLRQLVGEGAFWKVAEGGSADRRTKKACDAERRKYELATHKAATLLENILPLIFTFKNPAFSEENEVRIVYNKVGGMKTQFISRKDRIVPAKIFSFENIAIGRVVIGPKNVTTKETVKLALEAFGMKHVDVAESKSTYR